MNLDYCIGYNAIDCISDIDEITERIKRRRSDRKMKEAMKSRIKRKVLDSMGGRNKLGKKIDERVKLILQELRADDNVLNVGCADCATGGVWLHALVYEKVKSVIGIDVLESEVKKFQDMGYNMVVGDVEDMQLGKKFDVIIAGELIEHLSNPGKFLDRARDHLKDNGRLILTTPNAWCFHRFVSAAILGKVPVNSEHTCWYDKATVIQLLNRHGFKIDKIKFVRIPSGRKTTVLGNLLYYLGFKYIGSETLFIKCSLRENPLSLNKNNKA